MRILLGIILLGIILLVIPVFGFAVPADIMLSFGLLGKWAVNCNKPASLVNIYATYSGNGDLVYNFGDDRLKRIWEINSARIYNRNRIVFRATLVGTDEVAEFDLRKYHGKIQNYRVLEDDGTMLVNKAIRIKDRRNSAKLSLCY